MDDVKDKMKGLFKKVNKTFSAPSSSGRFQGQGRVLGSVADAGEQPAVSPLVQRFSAPSNSRPNPQKAARPAGSATKVDPKPSRAFDFSPWDPLISSGKRTVNGSSPEVFQSHGGSRLSSSEEEITSRVESGFAGNGSVESWPDDRDRAEIEARDDVAARIGEFVSSEPPKESVEVVLRLMKNVVREPDNDKFRRIRMGNPKIKQAVSAVNGAVELLECVGFRLEDEEGETWAKMDFPEEKQISLIKEAATLLERWTTADSTTTPSAATTEKLPEKEKIDRHVRVFFSIPESEAAKIDLPDSFYTLSAGEIRREAEMRRKKLEESQILIPRSFKEKQVKASQKKYRATCIRIQFPDGVVLQGVFLPWESTTALYEFVSSALKQPELEFDLMKPAIPRMRPLPRLSGSPGRPPPTLEEEELVPSALIKFHAKETDSVVFTGLANHLLEVSEPLTTR
ncbi:unnamed protein product [Spirodela intermedia]|uniref:UBX domain-containing protein n=1 Tax=Spirodela intermedia TaxID=51605 RepID=A0A7I8J3J1_SPIIN|nr:unnamed protein product [Spirodela intermedia]CAA6664818.1 unnamed protein product [Spirodela intermedia]